VNNIELKFIKIRYSAIKKYLGINTSLEGTEGKTPTAM